jgi:hypothetical protein
MDPVALTRTTLPPTPSWITPVYGLPFAAVNTDETNPPPLSRAALREAVPFRGRAIVVVVPLVRVALGLAVVVVTDSVVTVSIVDVVVNEV